MFKPDSKILVVDDLQAVRTLLKDILNQLGFSQLYEAADGQEALDILKKASQEKQSFDLIICDWNMPNMNGLELLQARNDDPLLQNIPFLMVTIESELEYVLKAISLGVSDYVVKPFSERTVAEKLKSIHSRLNS